MATITASLERSLQNCSLNQTTRTRRGNSGGGGGLGRSSSSDSPEMIQNHKNHNRSRRGNYESSVTTTRCSNASSSDENSTFLELNSHVSLPYHWEQCLDLKTGELYYINWSNGMKAKEDPRTTATGYNGDYYSEEEEDDDDDEEEEDEESNCYDSESSYTDQSSPCSSNRKESFRSVKKHQQQQPQPQQHQQMNQDSVLVVAGCKSCLMYYMVPKHEEDCPKCSGQLLHFAANNHSNDNSSP
ncbi:protein CURLY FLAG LEAF 1 isoform X2 [Spinacia oleracea]|uniref:Protein CURLY FLAG LEAF 1 isoform X2 n=1 Tax=Spinacia oleracea TaxID=3562 RepID=A0A9R0IB24_SPIOL|nr:protein CURLY FLAG LEAF 1 isoform X2 [Spinacia oleracea]